MNLNLTGHHVEITPAMRDYVTSKLSKIIRHFDHVIDVNVILSVEKLKQKAEANVMCGVRIFLSRPTVPICMLPSIAWWTSLTDKYSSTRKRMQATAIMAR